MSDTSKEIIRDANDSLSKGDTAIPGERLITSGLAAAIEEAGKSPLDVMQIVMAFDTFTQDNDLTYGSPEPTDLSQTKRVLTIMLASEY